MEKLFTGIFMATLAAICYSYPYPMSYQRSEESLKPRVSLLEYLREMDRPQSSYDYPLIESEDRQWYPYEERPYTDPGYTFEEQYVPYDGTQDDYYDELNEEEIESFLSTLESLLNAQNKGTGPLYGLDTGNEPTENEEEEEEDDEQELEDATDDSEKDIENSQSEDSEETSEDDILSKELEDVQSGSLDHPVNEAEVKDDEIQTPKEIQEEMDLKRGQPETVSVEGKLGAQVSEVQYDKKEENQLEELRHNPYDSLGEKNVNAKKASHPLPLQVH